jgi:hypothetical protein
MSSSSSSFEGAPIELTSAEIFYDLLMSEAEENNEISEAA